MLLLKIFCGTILLILIFIVYNFDLFVRINHRIQHYSPIGSFNFTHTQTYVIPTQMIEITNLSSVTRNNRMRIMDMTEMSGQMNQICKNEDWKTILKPCKDNLKWSQRSTNRTRRTDIRKSIFRVELRPCGGPSVLTIQTYDSKGVIKQRGGDYWRVHVRQGRNFSMVVVMRDDGKGSYEGVFTFVDPGQYWLYCTLEYSECDGIRDPPNQWFAQGMLPLGRVNAFVFFRISLHI